MNRFNFGDRLFCRPLEEHGTVVDFCTIDENSVVVVFDTDSDRLTRSYVPSGDCIRIVEDNSGDGPINQYDAGGEA